MRSWGTDVARALKPKDPNGPHARVYHSVLNSPAWRVLGPSPRVRRLLQDEVFHLRHRSEKPGMRTRISR
jgi:hypothetical protein